MWHFSISLHPSLRQAVSPLLSSAIPLCRLTFCLFLPFLFTSTCFHPPHPQQTNGALSQSCFIVSTLPIPPSSLSLSLSLFYLQFHSPWKHCGANSRGDGARGPSPRRDDPLLSLLSALWTSTAPCSAAADATGSKRPTLHYWWNCRFVRRELFSFSAPTSKSFPDKRCWATQKKKSRPSGFSQTDAR